MEALIIATEVLVEDKRQKYHRSRDSSGAEKLIVFKQTRLAHVIHYQTVGILCCPLASLKQHR